MLRYCWTSFLYTSWNLDCSAPLTVATLKSSRTCKTVISVQLLCIRILMLFLCFKLWINQNSDITIMVFFLFFFSGYKLHRTITERLQEVLENSTYTHSPEPTWLQWNCVSLVNDLYVTVNNWINVERQLIELMGAMWQVFTKSHIPPHFICTGL